MQGLGVSKGIAIGKAIIKKFEDFDVKKIEINNPENEISRFQEARSTAKEQLMNLHEHVAAVMGEGKADIFKAHIDLVNDRSLIREVEKKIKSDKANSEWALLEASRFFISKFETMKNEYMSQRAEDVKDVTRRILRLLLGAATLDSEQLEEEAVIVAEDLLPSDTAKMDRNKVMGFVTEKGGKTSHSAIMARTLEIPAVVGAEGVTEIIGNGDLLIIDGESGQILVNPEEEVILFYKEKKKEYEEIRSKLNQYIGVKSITRDGEKVEIAANIGTPNDLEAVTKNDAEGIGLFRTEFIYMDRNNLPAEEEQFEAYKLAAEKMNGKPVIIRTLDIGGDKALPYLEMPKEENPFLGYRAIRFCLDRREIFHTQLRAILRASAFGNVKIMFPMISNLSELREAKELLEKAKDSLKKDNRAYEENIKVGIMIEIPSAALLSDLFAEEVDFFSIGTNDLIQYMTAADRGNSKVSHLYNSCHPAVLRMIKLVIDNAHKKDKWVGMCGEAAGDPKLIPVFLGMGLDEFSMNPSSILGARSIINNLSKREVERFLDKILMLPTAEEIEKFIEKNGRVKYD